MSAEEVLFEAESDMEKAVEFMMHEFSSIRTGKASPALVEGIDVTAYGSSMKLKQLALITGQKPVVTRAKKSEAAFKLREGMPIGCKVTLRGERMYEFLDRLLSVALPRIRDFRGVPTKSFDGRGNYSLGIREQLIFPEIRYDKVDMTRGMDICIQTSARTDEEGRALLEQVGFPFRK